MSAPKTVKEYLASIGAKGGATGTGRSKKRGTKAYYAEISAKAHAAKAAKKAARAKA